jgi:hypothetical protein
LEAEVKSYVVYAAGPTLAGRVAVFDSERDAEVFCDQRNSESKYNPTSRKDEDGISLAWKMGDGRYWYCLEDTDLPGDYFG